MAFLREGMHAVLDSDPRGIRRMSGPVVTAVEFWPIDIPITDPFVVATGARVVAENVFIRMILNDGTRGYGEAAPFPEVGGEERASCVETLSQLASSLIGRPAANYRALAQVMADRASSQPSARCGLETALLDAHCRAANIPMWQLWGGADVRSRETDITIPIATHAKTLSLAQHWYARGFRLFKMKIGRDVEDDIHRLETLHQTLPDIAFIGDGNQGYSVEECLAFVRGVQGFGGRIRLLEQPVSREDLDGMASLRRRTGIPVAADEAVRSLSDARGVVKHGAADYINIKIMKTGVLEAESIASFTLASGLKLMIGGMVESRIAMGCSFSLVLGMKGFDVLDLDTPLLLSDDPIEGGYRYAGSHLQPWTTPGLGMSVELPPDVQRIN